MTKPKRIKWEAVEAAYVTGSESYRALAARFGISRGEVGKRAKAGEWTRKRKEFRDKAMTNAVQHAMRAREEEIIEGLRGTELVNKRAIEMLEAGNFLEFIVAGKQPCKEIEAISRVFLNVEESRRLLRGVMKPAEAEKLKLEREKWEHEIKREAEEETGKGKVEVSFDGELEDYAE